MATSPLKEDDAASLLAFNGEKASGGSGLLSKFPFLKSPVNAQQADSVPADSSSSETITSSSATVSAQPKTRRRRGSLRKVALLGRGAQQDKRDDKFAPIATTYTTVCTPSSAIIESTPFAGSNNALGLEVAKIHSPPGFEEFSAAPTNTRMASLDREPEAQVRHDTSATDEDDILDISRNAAVPRPKFSASSSSPESYFAAHGSSPRPSSFQQAKSPLSYSGMSTNTITTSDVDWDYAETEWWGWVVMTVTWLVFVIGMGSCLDIWSWAWDVGRTPYAPPELEDDPTLPIVGYYPALIILTCVMAWVWVVVAWVGMKYFRHAKISGD